jgi:hypothetical protein
MNDPDIFVKKRLSEKPVEYTGWPCHMVIGGEWVLGVRFEDVGDSPRDRAAIVSDLRDAADILEKSIGAENGSNP